MAEPYTPDPADVELVERAWEKHTGSWDGLIFVCQICGHVGDQHLATVALTALAAAGRLQPASGEPDLWQYGRPDPDEGPDAVMAYDGSPRVITPRMVRRPMRAVGPWQPVPAEGTDA